MAVHGIQLYQAWHLEFSPREEKSYAQSHLPGSVQIRALRAGPVSENQFPVPMTGRSGQRLTSVLPLEPSTRYCTDSWLRLLKWPQGRIWGSAASKLTVESPPEQRHKGGPRGKWGTGRPLFENLPPAENYRSLENRSLIESIPTLEKSPPPKIRRPRLWPHCGHMWPTCESGPVLPNSRNWEA